MKMWMLGAVFALAGTPMIWLALRAFARDRAIARWPRAPGVVTSARVDAEERSYRDQDGHSGTWTAHRPVVQYRYTVEGQTLDGTRVHRNDDTATNRDPAQRTIDKYPPGREVSVLYDPKDPKTAYLETQTSVGAVILCAFGGFWLALGGLLVGLSLAYGL